MKRYLREMNVPAALKKGRQECLYEPACWVENCKLFVKKSTIEQMMEDTFARAMMASGIFHQHGLDFPVHIARPYPFAREYYMRLRGSGKDESEINYYTATTVNERHRVVMDPSSEDHSNPLEFRFHSMPCSWSILGLRHGITILYAIINCAWVIT
ncbi:Nn.00g033610.m01.CDS01 [Neocucurbitaria sp. VM-36]